MRWQRLHVGVCVGCTEAGEFEVAKLFERVESTGQAVGKSNLRPRAELTNSRQQQQQPKLESRVSFASLFRPGGLMM